jgi:hypothetical protein
MQKQNRVPRGSVMENETEHCTAATQSKREEVARDKIVEMMMQHINIGWREGYGCNFQ